MTIKQLALSGGLIAGLYLTGAAHAQGFCADRATVLDRLTNAYGETVQGMGLGANNGIVEVFASDETGTWTITVTLPDGTTCLLASGEAYEGRETLTPEAPGEDV